MAFDIGCWVTIKAGDCAVEQVHNEDSVRWHCAV